MIPLSVMSIAKAIGAATDEGVPGGQVQRVIIDSRDARPGDLFFALEGEQTDGHRFVEQALDQGAAACICARSSMGMVQQSLRNRCAWVDDAFVAMGRLAAYYRREILPKSTRIVAVTGSNGKTTTKCMIDHLLRESLKGRCSPRSFNNHIGVPLTLLGAEAHDRYVVAEIGTNAPGEIAALASIVRPDVGVITSIGEAHLEGLGDIGAVAAEKASLLNHIDPPGVAFVTEDLPRLLPEVHGRAYRVRTVTFGTNERAQLRVTNPRGTLRHTRFVIDDRYEVELTLPGLHHATNAAAAFAVGRWFALEPARMIDRLRSFRPADGRARVMEVGDVTVVDDTYNANPASVAAAIEALRLANRGEDEEASGRRVFVMGDMLELGEACDRLHRAAVRAVFDAGIEVLLTVGPCCAAAVNACAAETDAAIVSCPDADSGAHALRDLVVSGDSVWLKGSRKMGLESIVAELQRSSALSVELDRPRVAVA